MSQTKKPAGDRLAELDEERDFLLRSLADLELEHQAGDVDDHDYATLQDDYTTRAARVLREIQANRSARPPRPPVRWRRTISIATVTVLAGLGLGLLLSHSIGERKAGTSITGGVAALDDSNTLLSQARAMQMADPLQAIKLFSQVLEKEPNNVEALTYRGWTTALIALQTSPDSDQRPLLTAAAARFLGQAVAANPSYPDAQCFSAVVAFRLQSDAAAAKPFFDRCEAGNPPASVSALLGQLGADIDTALAAPTATTTASTTTT